MQPPLPNNPPPRIYDVILHYISVDRHFSVHFYVHFSFLRVCIEGGAFLLYVRPPLVDRRFSMSIQTSTGAYSCTPASIQGFITAKIKLLQNKPTLKREYRPPCCIYSLGTKSPHEIISIANFLANNNQDYHE